MFVAVYYRVNNERFRVDVEAETVVQARQRCASELAMQGSAGRVFMARQTPRVSEHGLNKAYRVRQYIK